MTMLRGLLGTLAGLLVSATAMGQNLPLTVAAASDLKFALEEIAAKFQADTGMQVRLSFGSSGNFFQQLQRGAPFEMFMSADEGLVYKLADAGLTRDRGDLYAVGRIVIAAPPGAPYRPDARLSGFAEALKSGKVTRFAIANPEHAPYGRAAEQALKSLGLWERVRPTLVLGENVSQAAQFAMSGSTQGGIFAYSLALAPVVMGNGTYVLIPENLHEPLRQRMVLMKGAGGSSSRFYDYVREGPARVILRKYGFVLPGEG